MGQQQLFKLIMVVIIVGVAMFRGLAMLNVGYSEYAHESEIRELLLAAAAKAQAWYRRPAEMGGGGRSFTMVSWTRLNLILNTTIAKFSMSGKAWDHFHLTGISKDDTTLIIKYLVYPDSVVAAP